MKEEKGDLKKQTLLFRDLVGDELFWLRRWRKTGTDLSS